MRTALRRVRIILVRPLYSGNVGSTARAMANCGLSRLVLVAPVADPASDEARRMAAHARPILARARREAELSAALDGTVLAVATTARARSDRIAAVSPWDAARRIVAAAGEGDVAVLFGPEDEGLGYADLVPCALRVTIPTAPEHTSLNLSQAVLVVAHAIFMAATGGPEERAPARATGASSPPKIPIGKPPGARPSHGVEACGVAPAAGDRAMDEGRAAEPAPVRAVSAASTPGPIKGRKGPGAQAPASFEAVRGALDHLTRVLGRAGFLNPQNPDQGFEVLRHLFIRAGMSDREVRTLRGMLRQIEWALGEASFKR